jgi:hypothetical protein
MTKSYERSVEATMEVKESFRIYTSANGYVSLGGPEPGTFAALQFSFKTQFTIDFFVPQRFVAFSMLSVPHWLFRGFLHKKRKLSCRPSDCRMRSESSEKSLINTL